MTTTAEQTFDVAAVERFAGTLMETYAHAQLTYMIEIGYRTGLFEAAAQGTATSAELADRAGLHERYVREWLSAVATAGVFTYEPTTRSFTLPAEHAACLCGGGAANMAVVSQLCSVLGSHLDEVITAFREGGGVPYERFRPRFTDVMDKLTRGAFDSQLLHGVLPITGLAAGLERGIRVADVGCGTGHAVNLLAAAYPASDFVGYDFAPDAIELARAEAAGLGNARFEIRDVVTLPTGPPLDAVFAFDAIHDQVDPAGVLRAIREALAPGGTFVMVDVKASSDLADNIGDPTASLMYSTSVLHCMTVSLSGGGAGLGTAWGEQLARRMLAEAGFEVVSVSDAPEDPVNSVYVCRKP